MQKMPEKWAMHAVAARIDGTPVLFNFFFFVSEKPSESFFFHSRVKSIRQR